MQNSTFWKNDIFFSRVQNNNNKHTCATKNKPNLFCFVDNVVAYSTGHFVVFIANLAIFSSLRMQNTTKNGEKFQVPENAETQQKTKLSKTLKSHKMAPEKNAKQCRKMQKMQQISKSKKPENAKKDLISPL